MQLFGEATRAWFESAFTAPTEIQERGWPAISRGANTLLLAPTGSGKTLAAFLWALDGLGRRREVADGTRVVYVSPLKALVYDIERNLRAPLAGIRAAASAAGTPWPDIRVDVRTGDTPQRERARQRRKPGDILVTTPESLYLMLGSGAREGLRNVRVVIVDEVHALAGDKRGAHLALSLERLSALGPQDPQRIGLSATVRPADAVARFLSGARPVEVVDAGARPRLALTVKMPSADPADPANAADPGDPANAADPADSLYAANPPHDAPPGSAKTAPAAAKPAPGGFGRALNAELLAGIRNASSSIVFVNSRGHCERLCRELNELAGEELVLAHHGSVAHERRAQIEGDVKAGRVRGIVATSSLELGIDMDAVDQVALVESPGSVARGLQRVGRAGHGVGERSLGYLYPRHRADLLECAVIAGRMLDGEIEALQVPANPLDVLAQQIVAICCERPRTVAELATLVRRAQPYQGLSDTALRGVLDMLSGAYPSTDFADLRPRLAWDRARDELSPRKGAELITRFNAGTIPDRGTYAVYAGEGGPRVGELDEEMVFESRDGDVIALGATSWRIERITRDRVLVSPAPGEPGRLPFWRGDGPGRAVELGRAMGALLRELAGIPAGQAAGWLAERLPLDERAAHGLAAYVAEQRAHTGSVPNDRLVVIERFRDELGDWRVCILSPFGARVHAPWAMALEQTLGATSGIDVQASYTDDGIVLRFAAGATPPGPEALLPDPDRLIDTLTGRIAETPLFAGAFRENAVRALLVTGRGPGRRNPLWLQRLKARELLATARRYPAFPIVLETYRQVLNDVFDLAQLKEILSGIASGAIALETVDTPRASPFARALVFSYVNNWLYAADLPLAERRVQALQLDRALLGELLGEAELRALIDPEALAALEDELQSLAPARRATDADRLHDMLRRLGDLGAAELAARCAGPAGDWLESLAAQQRVCAVEIAGERRWIAAGDAGLYRAALAVEVPDDLPAVIPALTDPLSTAPGCTSQESTSQGSAGQGSAGRESTGLATTDPLSATASLPQLLRRFARTRGPFAAREAATRFGLPLERVAAALAGLVGEGVMLRGEIRPGRSGMEYCDAAVLRRLKRRSLERLRDATRPVDGPALTRFLLDWQGVGRPASLEDTVARLEGLALPWSVLSEAILPARVAGFAPQMLDAACAGGDIVWVGQGALGARDGRIAMYRRAHLAGLHAPPAEPPAEPLQRAVLGCLRLRGASFLLDIDTALRDAGEAGAVRTTGELESALWALVWGGWVSNDTFAPLRSLGRAQKRGRRGADTRVSGRWYALPEAQGRPDPRAADTARSLAHAQMLLARYGVVSRESARAEGLPGGFGAVYPVLRAMEEAGQVRRGFFVEDLSGAQFATAGSVEGLRTARGDAGPVRDEAVVQLAAVDPANPYGALLSWPESAGEKGSSPKRVAGAWVVLVEGRLLLYVGAGGSALLTFPSTDLRARGAFAAAFRSLNRLPRLGRRRLPVIRRIDGEPAERSPFLEELLEAGFVHDYRGLVALAPAAGH